MVYAAYSQMSQEKYIEREALNDKACNAEC